MTAAEVLPAFERQLERTRAAHELVRARWYSEGRCIDCGWMLEDYELAAGFERCGGCDDGKP